MNITKTGLCYVLITGVLLGHFATLKLQQFLAEPPPVQVVERIVKEVWGGLSAEDQVKLDTLHSLERSMKEMRLPVTAARAVKPAPQDELAMLIEANQ